MQKYAFLKLDLRVKRQYFWYEKYINRLQIDEILTYVFMYGGSSISILRYSCLNSAHPIFIPFSSLWTHFRHIPTLGVYFPVKSKIYHFLVIKVFGRHVAFKKVMTCQYTRSQILTRHPNNSKITLFLSRNYKYYREWVVI